MRTLLSSALLVSLAACGSEDEYRPATFKYIYPAIIVPNCTSAGCHSQLSKQSGRYFTDYERAREDLKDLDFPILRGTFIDGNTGGYKRRMPPDQPLPEKDILLISRWAEAGRPEE